MGTQHEVTTVTKKAIMKTTDEYLEQMTLLKVASAQESAYNVGKLKGVVDHYKEKMAKIKETPIKEQGEGREVKRKHEATLSYLERFQDAY